MGTLAVELRGDRVGTLRSRSDGSIIFTFAPDWIELPEAMRAVLSQSLTPFGRQAPDVSSELLNGRGDLPPFFANLLPEGPSRRLVAKANEIDPTDSFNLLNVCGGSLFGAVTVREVSDHDEERVSSLMRRLTAAFKPLNPAAVPFKNGFALAGVQRKIPARRDDVGRLALAHHNDDGLVLKIPTGKFPMLVANEFSMLSLAREAGFPVVNSERVSVDKIPFLSGLASGGIDAKELLVVERFDRSGPGERRIHAEDLCQAIGEVPANKYKISHEELAKVLLGAGISIEDFVRRVALNAITGNGDGHAKNFALVYGGPAGRIAELAPVFDQLFTAAYSTTASGMACSIGGKRDWASIDLDAFRRFAADLGESEIAVIEAVMETHDAIMSAWGRVRKETPRFIVEAIEDFWETESGLAVDIERIKLKAKTGSGS